jgi:hypothetical protein
MPTSSGITDGILPISIWNSHMPAIKKHSSMSANLQLSGEATRYKRSVPSTTRFTPYFSKSKWITAKMLFDLSEWVILQQRESGLTMSRWPELYMHLDASNINNFSTILNFITTIKPSLSLLLWGVGMEENTR